MKSEKLSAILDRFGQRREPVFFLIDFEIEEYYVCPLDKMDNDICFSFEQKPKRRCKDLSFKLKPINFERYKKAFKNVQEEIKKGNTYLLNLTFPSKFFTDCSLKEIYECSDAKFKLLFKDRFVCFSPERFIKIEDDSIMTFPMKGTIDASFKNAEQKILNNKKEMAEHTMIVDLLRNDLSMVSKRVRVERFRYCEKIKAGKRELIQVSSKIKGDLENGWQNRLGKIITKLLPAGSISGTPKKKTVELIKEIEDYKRGFFSGIFGYFDGKSLDSAVMIRFIERNDFGFVYKSGGGITIDSDAKKEYQEMCEKVYVPFF